jgi:hypothetical protein
VTEWECVIKLFAELKLYLTCLLQTDKKSEHYVVGSNCKTNKDGIFNFDSISAIVKS